jgi:uncharacterized protein
MAGETNLQALINTMEPVLHQGDYVFATVADIELFDITKMVSFFKEEEGYTIIIEKQIADEWQLPYNYIAAWITLSVYSSLEAVGLTAAFSKALGNAGISCNVVAAYNHDHIFVDKKDGEKAMEVLKKLTGNK